MCAEQCDIPSNRMVNVTSVACAARRKLEEMDREHGRSREEEERLHKEVRSCEQNPSLPHPDSGR